jgi:hypothetical protein
MGPGRAIIMSGMLSAAVYPPVSAGPPPSHGAAAVLVVVARVVIVRAGGARGREAPVAASVRTLSENSESCGGMARVAS